MSEELYGMLWLFGCNVFLLLLHTADWVFFEKKKYIAKEIARSLGLVIVGSLEALFVVFICWLV